MTPSNQAMEKAREITDDWFNKNIGYFDSAGNSLVKESDLEMLGEAIAAALDEQLAGVKFERDQFEKAAEEWMEACDALKNKYEPSRGATS